MAKPYHPKSKQIDQMLWRFCSSKEIQLELRVDARVVLGRSSMLGLHLHRITDDERRMVEMMRKARGQIHS